MAEAEVTEVIVDDEVEVDILEPEDKQLRSNIYQHFKGQDGSNSQQCNYCRYVLCQ